jgi:hypothetical protein
MPLDLLLDALLIRAMLGSNGPGRGDRGSEIPAREGREGMDETFELSSEGLGPSLAARDRAGDRPETSGRARLGWRQYSGPAPGSSPLTSQAARSGRQFRAGGEPGE